MKSFANDLKKIFTGFAHEHAADYLTIQQKIQLLGAEDETIEPETEVKAALATPKIAAKHIAIVTDGRGLDAPLDYAIEASNNQYTQIDLLIHGAMDMQKISAMEKRIRQAGLACRRIHLGANAIEHLMTYVRSQPSLLFMVAKPDDSVARNLLFKASAKGIHRMYIPLVLIEDGNNELSAESAA